MWERATLSGVWIIARRALRACWERHPDAQPLRAWYHDTRQTDWRSPADVNRTYANESIVGDDRVVFNIKDNKLPFGHGDQLPTWVCYVRFVGTHQAYDRIDVASV